MYSLGISVSFRRFPQRATTLLVAHLRWLSTRTARTVRVVEIHIVSVCVLLAASVAFALVALTPASASSPAARRRRLRVGTLCRQLAHRESVDAFHGSTQSRSRLLLAVNRRRKRNRLAAHFRNNCVEVDALKMYIMLFAHVRLDRV